MTAPGDSTNVIDQESWSMGDHGPDVPFGCPKDFGPLLRFAVFPDMRVHSCASTELNHAGPHVCKCGASEVTP